MNKFNLNIRAWVILACFVLWPAIHFVLVAQFKIEAWKFGGWAMYAVPQQLISVAANLYDNDGKILYSLPSSQHPRGTTVLANFRNWHQRVGNFYPRKNVAFQLFATYPQAQSTTVEVIRLEYQSELGRYAFSKNATNFRQ